MVWHVTKWFCYNCMWICDSINISVQSSLSGHKNIIRYIDSSITTSSIGIHEVLLLMQYYKGKKTEFSLVILNRVIELYW